MTLFIMQGNHWGWFSPVQIALYVVTVVAFVGLVAIPYYLYFGGRI